MNYRGLSKLAFLIFLTDSLSADPALLYKNYLNQTYDSSKNSIMGGATTATAKGYSAILTNPAGLSTNANMTLYFKTVAGEKTDQDSVKISDINPEDNLAVGFLYDEFAIEYKLDNYIALGGAYGLDTRYGLFSLGASYLMDQTDRDGESATSDDEFATGDYPIVGTMWQKSFVDEDDFYSVYFGFSYKMSGQHTSSGNTKIIPVSPEKLSYGIGLETNIFDTSLLFTFDMTEESWKSSSEKLSGTAYGLKWLIGEKFAIGGGMNSQTFSGSKLKDINSVGAGVEFGFWVMHFNVSYLQRTVNDTSGEVYLTEDSAHIDAVLVF